MAYRPENSNPSPPGRHSSDPWEVHTLGMNRRASGHDTLVLSIGEHDGDPDPVITESLKLSLDRGRHRYTSSGGEPDLREAAARWQSHVSGVLYQPHQVIITPGAQCALFAALHCLCDPGDEVLVFDPMYVTYQDTINACGARAVPVPMRRDGQFVFDTRALAKRITTRSRVILVNSPHNPTGAVLDASTAGEIVSLAEKHDLWIVSDEVYSQLTFDAPHLGIASVDSANHRTVTLNSLSKSHAMSGWRLGWLAAPAEIATTAESLMGCMMFGLPPFIQDAALTALATGPLPEMTGQYLERRDTVLKSLSRSPVLKAVSPGGSMFVMIDVSKSGLDGQKFAMQLLDQYDIAVLPGEAFGHCGDGFIRLSLCAEPDVLADACHKLRAIAESAAGKVTG